MRSSLLTSHGQPAQKPYPKSWTSIARTGPVEAVELNLVAAPGKGRQAEGETVNQVPNRTPLSS